MTKVLDFVDATEGDRALFRAALRGALLRHSGACRLDAWSLPEDDPRRDELLTEAHEAMERVVELEAA